MTKNNFNIINTIESQTIEFKSNFNIQVIETLVAFANTKGGKVLIGIEDNGNYATNISYDKETIPTWLNEIKTKTQPALIPDIEIIEIDGKQIIEISIPEFPIKPVSCKGKYFKRVKNSNHQLNLNEISLMHLKTFNSSWDYYFDINHDIVNISEIKVDKFISLWNKNHINKIEESNFDFLQKLELIRDNKITNACFLLFSKNETILSTIEIGRFQDPITIKDSISLSTDLISEVDAVLEFILKHIRKEYIITGKPARDEVWEYPLEAIREIIMNMIVHRDYMQSGESIIKIYDNRIEFFNPGHLPESISIENLLNGSYISDCRNKLISKAFKEIGWIEKYGSGIRRIIDIFVKHGCPKPIFENFQHGFRVIVYSRQSNVPENVTDITDKTTENVTDSTDVTDKTTENVTDSADVTDKTTENVTDSTDVTDKTTENVTDKRSEQILNIINANNQISTAEIAEILNVTKRTILRDIEKLKIEKKIKRIGSEKAGCWKITEHNNFS